MDGSLFCSDARLDKFVLNVRPGKRFLTDLAEDATVTVMAATAATETKSAIRRPRVVVSPNLPAMVRV
ncbi:MAG: hypothetical protein DMF64_21250 [Acidobacteria bacterium]|nr:MAG: hypothetical protein DMF64_21250 [Acidobacteriota bacterium]